MNRPMMRQAKKAFFLALLLVSSGCATVKVSLYNKDIHYPATDPRSIEVFQKKPEDRKFVEIGEITVEGATGMDQVERIFRIKAAEYGGAAVYVFQRTVQSRTYVTPHDCHYYDGFVYLHGRRHFYRHYYPQYYYYCYGYNDVETVDYMTVVGIVIRYLP